MDGGAPGAETSARGASDAGTGIDHKCNPGTGPLALALALPTGPVVTRAVLAVGTEPGVGGTDPAAAGCGDGQLVLPIVVGVCVPVCVPVAAVWRPDALPLSAAAGTSSSTRPDRTVDGAADVAADATRSTGNDCTYACHMARYASSSWRVKVAPSHKGEASMAGRNAARNHVS